MLEWNHTNPRGSWDPLRPELIYLDRVFHPFEALIFLQYQLFNKHNTFWIHPSPRRSVWVFWQGRQDASLARWRSISQLNACSWTVQCAGGSLHHQTHLATWFCYTPCITWRDILLDDLTHASGPFINQVQVRHRHWMPNTSSSAIGVYWRSARSILCILLNWILYGLSRRNFLSCR